MTSLSAQRIADFIKSSGGSLAILTGAGISTGSGIPDYRGPNGVYASNRDYKPIQYQQFVSDHAFRQRYWARSALGWPQVQRAKPNDTHHALTQLYDRGWVRAGMITQNVDGLLGRNALELHGTLYKVECISCHHSVDRSKFQDSLLTLNPTFKSRVDSNTNKITIGVRETRPDGDAELDSLYPKDFRYPDCESCGDGMYKPNVVFFGENMTAAVRDKSYEIIDKATHLLVVGTSLQVYSSFRLLKRAKDKGDKVAVLNLGAFRGSEFADLIVDESSDAVLPQVVELLDGKNKAAINKKRKFVADGVFFAELNSFLGKELAEQGYSGVEVRVTPTRTEIIIRATKTQDVLGDKGRRIRELTSVVQKRFNFPENTVELYAEKVAARGLSAIAQAESLRYKLIEGLAVRRACYAVMRFAMESGAKGVEVIVSGKLRGARAKAMKFVDGFMIHSGQPSIDFIDFATRNVLMRQGMIGIKVKIMLPVEYGKRGKMPLPDNVTILEPKEDVTPAAVPVAVPVATL
ncbi:40S ribosomal protein S3 [Chytriomyces hyalinus]|nr:40S ribosomal protein S3 [Chytriomyces hyalinus]